MTQAKILFVDDEPLLRLTVGSDLQDAGYVVKTAEDGHQACAELAENSYDLVVTDLVMEGINGMQVVTPGHSL
ncbi:MAG: response regulator [Deltaproteobacteria bacterium]|nr:response regulator [Deltaproteobacteria bacterium]